MTFSIRRALMLLVVAAAFLSAPPAHAVTIFLDADTPATGSNLDVLPLVTAAGTITFGNPGEIENFTDPEFTAAGASGNHFNIDDAAGALMMFDFDVLSISLIYGGNGGVFDIEARDFGGAVVDSFFQASTGPGESAGPITLNGPGIRSIFWVDPGFNFSAIDNVSIEAQVPEPSTLALLGLALGAVGFGARRRRTH